MHSKVVQVKEGLPTLTEAPVSPSKWSNQLCVKSFCGDTHTLHLCHCFWMTSDPGEPLVGGSEWSMEFYLHVFFFQEEGGEHFVL